MNFKITTIFTNLIFLFLLNNCVSSGTAFLGPAVTVAKTGNVLQGGLSYSSSEFIKSKTGKDVSEIIKTLVQTNYKVIDPIKTLVQTNHKIIDAQVILKNEKDHDYDAFLDAVNKVLN